MKKIALILGFMLSLMVFGCSQQQNTQSNAGNENEAAKPSSEVVTTINMTEVGGNLEFVEYAPVPSYLFLGRDQHGKEDQSIILYFKYTNNEDVEKSCADDYEIKVYQNGAELSEVLNYYQGFEELEPKFLESTYSQTKLIQGGSRNYGYLYILEDNSPLTVIAKYKGTSQNTQKADITFELTSPEPVLVSQKSDITGKWKNVNGGTYLELSDADFWFYVDPSSKAGGYWNIDGNYLYEGSSSIFGHVYKNNGTLMIIMGRRSRQSGGGGATCPDFRSHPV